MAEKQKSEIYEMSVIVPIYNVEEYLQECLDSILKQDLSLELILINDGSTDASGEIANSYSLKYDNIILINQEHCGPSIARNKGLEIAKGTYIAFIDSDDHISENSLKDLYQKAKENDLDMILGKMVYCYPDGNQVNMFQNVPEKIKNKVFSGKECFISLMTAGIYYPMACSFICKNNWVRKHTLRFDENIIHEDEVWTQIGLCLADKVLLTDIDFYYYRKRQGSIMHSLDTRTRLRSLFHICSRFMKFSSRYSFDGEDGILKSWIYANTYRIYSLAFSLLPKIKDSTFILPDHYLYTFPMVSRKMLPDARKRCYQYYQKARNGLKKYYKWLLSPWNMKIPENISADKRIILLYNNPEWHEYSLLRNQKIDDKYYITADRKYFSQAFAVVFYLLDLFNDLEYDLNKPKGQVWISWNMESEDNHTWMKNPNVTQLFDLSMAYQKDADVVCPYYKGVKEKSILKAIDPSTKQNKVCMMISSKINQSKRIEYLQELMQYIEIDSYGKLFNNKELKEDNGEKTKLDIYSRYKFIIAFENAITDDYVTEKFYDPLLAGSVPVYMGASNIEEFVPGDNCFVNVSDYSSPKELAEHLNKCFGDNNKYLKYHEWRNKPFLKRFTEKEEMQDIQPVIRLCHVLNEKYP